MCTPDEVKQVRFTGDPPSIIATFICGLWSLEEIYDLKEGFKIAMEHLMGTDVYEADVSVATDAYYDRENAFFAVPGNESKSLNDFYSSTEGIRAAAAWHAVKNVPRLGGRVQAQMIIE